MCNVEGPPLRNRKPQPLPPAEPYPIYLDYNATTPLCEEAWSAMCSVHNVWGNPSSNHPYGLAAKYALELARKSLAHSLHVPNVQITMSREEEQQSEKEFAETDNALRERKIYELRVDPVNSNAHNHHTDNKVKEPWESIIFTSCGTESNNLAIIGGLLSVNERYPCRRHVISTNVEHPAVAEVLKFLNNTHHSSNFACHEVAVNSTTGQLEADTLRNFLRSIDGGASTVAVVSVMYANNEIGTVNDIASLVAVVKEECGKECLFHTDAAQSLGKIPVNVEHDRVDLLSVCAHKFYGPKGVAALYIRPGVHIKNIIFGAGHENGIRPGTENVLLVTGMAKALEVAVTHIKEYSANMQATRDELMRVLQEELHKFDMNFVVNGDISRALPNTLNCAIYKNARDYETREPITYISAPRLIISVGDLVCMSAGSACHSTSDEETLEVSAPLRGIGVELKRAIGTLRLSTGRQTTIAEVRRAARIIARHTAQQFAEETT